jgi:L-seryl-tRNA(Ser) seleniumtransferase
MTIAALDSVLALHEAGRRQALPVPRMLSLPLDEIDARARRLRHLLVEKGAAADLDVRDVSSAVGGGAAPDTILPSRALAVRSRLLSADALARRLRESNPPVIARIEEGLLLLDLRTVLPGEDIEIERALLEILRIPTGS